MLKPKRTINSPDLGVSATSETTSVACPGPPLSSSNSTLATTSYTRTGWRNPFTISPSLKVNHYTNVASPDHEAVVSTTTSELKWGILREIYLSQPPNLTSSGRLGMENMFTSSVGGTTMTFAMRQTSSSSSEIYRLSLGMVASSCPLL